MPLIYLGPVVAVLLLTASIASFVASASARRSAMAEAMAVEAGPRRSLFAQLNARFRRSRPGRWLATELARAGSSHQPLAVALAGLGVSVLVFTVLWTYLAPVLAFVGLVAGYLAIRWYVRRGQERRREAFVAQLPELARVLSNGTHAGLSLPTAIAVAADEMDEPTRGELRRVADAVRFGQPLELALAEVEDRMPSREVRVLMSTLVISARSGGALVSSLRSIADTLDTRKETRREIKTLLSQALATSNLIVLMGVGVLFLLNAIMPGSVEKMTQNPIGIAALTVSGLLFAGGYLGIRRLARIED